MRRTESLRDEVEKLERKERDGQSRFRELLELKDRLEAECQEMELLEGEFLPSLPLLCLRETDRGSGGTPAAERINEQALASMDDA